MILAEKLLLLRKGNGWSQEELAEKLNVSRQSISKWESAAAIPDINRILDLANIFGITTDYLLKDDMESMEYSSDDEADTRTLVTLQETNEFLASNAAFGRQIAFGVMLGILAPVLLILLGGLEDAGAPLSDVVAYSVGMVSLLLMACVAIAIFIISSAKMKRFQYLENGEFTFAYGVLGIIKEKRAASEKAYLFKTVFGIVLCILAILPLIIAGIIGASDMLYIIFTALILVVVSIGVFLIVSAGIVKSGYDRLMLEGEYKPETKEENRKIEKFGSAYWPIVVAVYLGWSLLTHDWQITWIVWPVAALVFAGISATLEGRRH